MLIHLTTSFSFYLIVSISRMTLLFIEHQFFCFLFLSLFFTLFVYVDSPLCGTALFPFCGHSV
jgi:hypothetical protein